MKKVSLIFIGTIIALGLITGLFYTAKVNPRSLATDSGFDSSFDSGGGFDSGGSSWDYGGSSSGGSGEMTIGGAIFTMIAVIFIIVIFSLLAVGVGASGNTSTASNLTTLSSAPPNELELISKYGYNPETIVLVCYNRYVDIQTAWASNDIEKAKDILTNDLYNMYKGEIATLKAKKQRNAMSDFKYVDGKVLSVTETNNTLNIKIALQVDCKDYMVDERSNSVVRGDSSRINHYDYRMTYVLSKSESTDKCPNCNAKLKGKGNTVKCEYCGSTIVRKTNNVVLAEKKMFRQW
jgi:DNA-directed RNA polymerase subunit RPC12/RpoP